jgi:hypothetical protein
MEMTGKSKKGKEEEGEIDIKNVFFFSSKSLTLLLLFRLSLCHFKLNKILFCFV